MDFVKIKIKKLTDFDEKLKSLNKKVTLNKTRHLEVKNKLDDLSEKNKLISTKRLTKGLINNCCVFNDGKYFGENGRQNYLLFQPFSR